ncbi:MAG TPA: hypothetical protein VIL00_05745 [Pseudonocardiaceae bacterium]
MNPRERADELLARARSRGAFVVTPDDATSPMDAASTVQIPRIVIDAADSSGADDPAKSRQDVDPDSTVILPTAGSVATLRINQLPLGQPAPGGQPILPSPTQPPGHRPAPQGPHGPQGVPGTPQAPQAGPWPPAGPQQGPGAPDGTRRQG